MLKSLLNKKNNKGFTLVELIVVIAIMAILAVAVTPKLTQFLDKSKIATDKEIANTICTAFTSVSLDADAYATIPDQYKKPEGVDIFATPADATKNLLYYAGDSNHKYTAKEKAALGKFEAAVKAIIPTDFTLKSAQWAKSEATCTVIVTGEGIVSVTLSDGAATNPVTYTVSKN